MKSIIAKILVLVILLGVVVASDSANAFIVAGSGFGGSIVNTKATEIQSMENANYKCTVPGTTITIKSNDSSDPTTYIIPSGTKSKTSTTPRANQKIKGIYGRSKTTITCIYQGYPPQTQSVQLTPITMYGTSR